jgi:hypothetical protein
MRALAFLMILLSIAFFILKVCYLAYSQYFINDLNSCFSNGDYDYSSFIFGAFSPPPATTTDLTTDVAPHILSYVSILKNMALITRNLAIASVVFAGVIWFYHHWKGQRARRHLRSLKENGAMHGPLRRADRVTRPLVMILIGAFTVLFEAYTLGAVISTHYNSFLIEINMANVVATTHKCVASSRLDMLYDLTWASVVLYVAILVIGHWTGLEASYAREKIAIQQSQGGGYDQVSTKIPIYIEQQQDVIDEDEEEEACC